MSAAGNQLALPFDAPRPQATAAAEPEAPPAWPAQRDLDTRDDFEAGARILDANERSARALSRERARNHRAAVRQKRAQEKADAKAAPPRRGPLARTQALPVADDAAAAAPCGERGHILAVAVTLTNPHADVWTVTARPLYGHAAAWRNTLRHLAKVGRTRAYDASQPRRRCTWDSLDGDNTL